MAQRLAMPLPPLLQKAPHSLNHTPSPCERRTRRLRTPRPWAATHARLRSASWTSGELMPPMSSCSCARLPQVVHEGPVANWRAARMMDRGQAHALAGHEVTHPTSPPPAVAKPSPRMILVRPCLFPPKVRSPGSLLAPSHGSLPRPSPAPRRSPPALSLPSPARPPARPPARLPTRRHQIAKEWIAELGEVAAENRVLISESLMSSFALDATPAPGERGSQPWARRRVGREGWAPRHACDAARDACPAGRPCAAPF